MPRRRRRSRRGIQGKLERTAGDSKLLRLLLLSVWFRIAVLGILLIVVGLGLSLLNIVTTSPPDASVTVKVSAINIFQSWRFQRNAERATDLGNHDGANYYWKAAIRKNPGSLELAEGALKNAAAAESQDVDWLRESVGVAQHYLQLANTNDVAIRLVAEFYEKRRMTRMVTDLLDPLRENLSTEAQRILLKSYFRQRRLPEFRELWDGMSEVARDDDESRLHYAAFQAGWGEIEESVDALQNLRRVAESTGAHQLTALHLLLAVHGHSRDASHYNEVLERLSAMEEDTHLQHAAYWILLHESSRQNVARHQAEDYWLNLIREPVRSPTELAAVARAYDQIGLNGKALDLFQSFDGEYSDSPEYWAAYGSILVRMKDWSDLRVLALKIRNEAFASPVIRAYSYYLEGLAEAGEGRTYNAGKSFDQVLKSDPDLDVDQALGMAWEVYGIGYPEIAAKLLERHRTDLERDIRYWEITFAGAYKLKRADQILEAANRMIAIDPENPVSRNNYAAALLVRRERPEEAIRHTLTLRDADPTSAGFVLNHGIALLQNGRIEEAEAHLRRLSIDGLRPEVATSLAFAWFELYGLTQDADNAEKVLLNVSEAHLFPEQLDWLENTKRKLGLVDSEAAPAALEPIGVQNSGI